MKLPTAFATAALAALLTAPGNRAVAEPASSWSTDDVPYGREECLANAERALSLEGWRDIKPSSSLGVTGRTNVSRAYIICLNGPSGTIAAIFVASSADDAGVPGSARNRLQYHMTRE